MPTSDWTHLRVRKATRDRLNQRIDDMRREYYAGHQSATPVKAGELSVDGLLQWLLDERERHRERARRAKAPRRGASASSKEAAPEPDSDAGSV